LKTAVVNLATEGSNPSLTAYKEGFSIMLLFYIHVTIKSYMKKILAVMFLVLVLGAFIWKGSVGLDPDFGWHIRSGEYILENGIPSFDPLSYTMPSFPFIDHAWGSSILFFLFYPVVSLCGLSFFAFLSYI
jgi:hypothetical protein